MKLFQTDDIKIWINFFKGNKKSNKKFYCLLKKVDKSFLTHPTIFDFEDDYYSLCPDLGFLENDIKKVMYDDNPKDCQYRTRIMMALNENTDFSYWLEKYEQSFKDAIEKSLISADYELYGIKFEDLLIKAINKKYIDRSELMMISVLRGALLGNRYPEAKDEKKLKIKVFINKLQIKLMKISIRILKN